MQTLSIKEEHVQEPIEITEGEHLIACFRGRKNGPTLLVFGSIHGNEHSGVKAMFSVATALEDLQSELLGDVYLIAGNTRAINENIRFIDTDLNRHWTPENAVRNAPASMEFRSDVVEDIEQREILEIIETALLNARNEVYSIDLHSTSSESAPFAMIGDTLRNRSFAQKFPATFLLGIEEQLEGTIMEYMNELGSVTLGFEAGQHTTDAAVRNQEALIWASLVNAGILPSKGIADKHFEQLRKATGDGRIIEIRHRHPIKPEDGFLMKPGYVNFQPVKKGEILASDVNGEIKAAETGLILMPLYQKLGEDGFFLGRRVAAFWLKLSWLLRKLRFANLMRFLPGVRRDPENKDALIVNTRVARIMPLQVFHLLGYRKRRWKGDKLVVSRRRHDTVSPFVSSG